MPTLLNVIEQVEALTVEEQRALFEYLEELVAPRWAEGPRPVVQVQGVLGTLDVADNADPIAEALDELRHERAAHLDEASKEHRGTSA